LESTVAVFTGIYRNVCHSELAHRNILCGIADHRILIHKQPG